MSDETWNDDEAALAPVAVQRLVDRYEVLGPLGEGGFAEVFRGRDTRTGRDVALKRLRPRADDRLLRRELVALRYARVPGVVRLLDDLRVDRETWLVLELASGGPFPGPDQPSRADPEDVRDRTIALLRILARLHRLGMAHQDLKPNNVLVDSAGAVSVLDLGIASAVWLGAARTDGFEGTLRFAAPEQRRQALSDDVAHDRMRADLYAVGAMVYEALSGAPRFPEMSRRDAWKALVVADVDPPFPPVREIRGGVPEDLAALVDALLSFTPADRPSDADAALAWLGVRVDVALPRRVAALPDVADAAILADVFHGPEALLHLPSRAASVLYGLTGGRRGEVERALRRWLAHEIVVADGERLRVDREALARLERDQRVDVDVARLPGDLAARWPALQVALLDARATSDVDAECRWVVEVAATAIQIEDQDALDHALRLLDDESGAPDLTRACAGLVRYWQAAAVRRERALADATSALAPSSLLDERLHANLQGARFMHAMLRGLDHADTLLDTLRTWASDVPYREARRQGWLGLLRYQQARYDEAAAAHARSRALREQPIDRTVAWANELLARMEAGEVAGVLRDAPRLIEEAATARLGRQELLGWVLLAAAAYRGDAAIEVPVDVRVHAPAVSVNNAASLQLVFAADAWRRRDLVAFTAARRAIEALAAPRAIRTLADAMALDLGAHDVDADDVVAGTAGCPPGIAAQILALLPPGARAQHAHRAAALAADVPGAVTRRREVLSMAEVVARVG